ncbi:phosphotransferase [Paenibacillus sp. RC67]|uniref:phosphotransferase enzyme family protein n=1 Tax=Paenibacillus sp. RC67 TaxID=3039392 RepID=UPI0024AD784A|nr:phosphotransferase [Paenibacillus sp. RC67]
MTNSTEARLVEESVVREDVFAHLKVKFNIEISSYSALYMGFHNWKWIVATPINKLFIKCYHPKRYCLAEANLRLKVSKSLSFQKILHDQAQVCPDVLSHEGKYIFQSNSGYFYVVMEHFEGSTPPRAGHLNVELMYRIGQATGRMHSVLSRYPGEGVHWTPTLGTMKEKWRKQFDMADDLPSSKAQLKRALERQGQLLSQLDLSLFDELEPGWAHWDLWSDNMLAGVDGDIRIVDFDTVQYGYQEIDIARAILSGSLSEGVLHIGPTAAFLKGYREEHSFPEGRLSLSLKLLWCREAHWWLKTDIDTFSAPPKRFAEELIWLTEHWDHLEPWFGRNGMVMK